MPNHPDRYLRPRDELLDLLEQRRRAFHQLSFDNQHAVNDSRFVDVDELHEILDHFLTHGHCADESADAAA
jgi:hypothetical protein